MFDRFVPRAMPDALAPLFDLALDLHWTWSHAGDALWRKQGPLWERTHNPWAVLQDVSQTTLESWARDPAFLEELRRVAAERERYLTESCWCGENYPDLAGRSIAYFSMEFGLGQALPLYAGGLGVLAGDFLKTASDLGIPVTGVGLLYYEGYFRQTIDAAGRQHEAYPYNDPSELPIRPVMDTGGSWLKVEIKFPGRILYLRTWVAQVGRVRLYLLDSNDPMNSPVDRGITAKLYGGGIETRLMQEMVLGVGGWTLLEKVGIEVDVCHMNEGHAALAILERARRFMKRHHLTFREALWATRAGNVFTTHTPVAAGFDVYPPEVIRQYSPYFHAYLTDLGISLEALLALGRATGRDDEPFNMAYLGMRGSAWVNGVSALHAVTSRALFRDLFPRWPAAEIPIQSITNGVHVPSWDSAWADRLWTDACGKARWLGALENLGIGINAIDDEALWSFKAAERDDLVRYVRVRMVLQRGQQGATPEHLDEASQLLDSNVLTLGFARRFAEYKRPNLLLADADRFARILGNPDRPVQIIVAGKAHPDDATGKRLVEAWMQFAKRADVQRRVVFIADYDMVVAQQLVQGVDVWINTPRRPWEACGTSGMKVLANGGLNLSALDGWWAEAYAPELGWTLSDHDQRNGPEQDQEEALQLYRLLENEVVPAFYERDDHGIPRAWVRRMRASIATLAPRYSSNRMAGEYVVKLYRPAAAMVERRGAEGARLGRELSQWHEALTRHWHEIHFGAIEIHQEDNEWRFSVPVYLGEISADAVRIELYSESADGDGPIRMDRTDQLPGALNAFIYRARVDAGRPSNHYTPRVIPYHPAACVPIECNLIAWQR